jgi:hypothetical protein
MKIIASLLLLFTSIAPGSAAVASWSAAEPNTAAPNAATVAFERLKRLAGEWEARAPKTYGNAVIQLHYRLISDDSVLVETFRIPEQDVEMLTVYHTDGKQLVLTHYCAVNNQVRMVADLGAITGPAAPIPSLTFAFRDGSNLEASHLQVMDRLRLAFDDDTHLTQTWRWRDQKAPTGEDTAVYSYTRVR